MRKLTLLPFLTLLLLASCNSSKDTDSNGIKLVLNEMTTTAHYLSLGHGKISGNEFSRGTSVYYVLDSVKGFVAKDGKIFPGCYMVVTNKEKKEILKVDDLFSEYKDGIDPGIIDAELSLYLTVDHKMEEGQTYDWHLRIWDKNGKGEMIADIPISVVKARDMVGVKSTPNGITSQAIYIMSNGPLRSSKVKEGQSLNFFFDDVEGFQMTDSLVNVGVEVTVKTKAGESVMHDDDLFKEMDAVSAKAASEIKVDLMVGDPILKGQTYTWTVRIFDKATTKSLEASVDIEVLN